MVAHQSHYLKTRFESDDRNHRDFPLQVVDMAFVVKLNRLDAILVANDIK